jgi:outer membrane protein assembly factor BamB
MKRAIPIACAALLGCARPTPTEKALEPPPIALSPGADLEGPIPAPVRDVRRHAHGSAAPIDFASDRPPLAIDVPTPPEGGAVGFTFADDRRGWVARLPGSQQLPAVAYGDGKIFASAGFSSYSFFALDADDGHILWSSQQLEDDGPTAPIFEDDRLYFNTESCTLFCMDARTGKKLWFKKIGDPTLSQPAVADGLVFAAHPGDTGPAFSAYRARDGAEVWTRTVGGELLAAPVIAGDSIYLSTTAGTSFRFTRANGRKVWSRELHATTAPWIAGDALYVSREKRGQEVQSVISLATGAVIQDQFAVDAPYLSSLPRAPAPTTEDWKKVWSFEGSRPVVMNGVRYAAMGGELEASDAFTGERLWSRRDPHARGRRSLGSVALAGTQLVVATRDGDLYGLDVDTGYTLWSYRTGHKIVAEPIVAKGWIFATTVDGEVIAMQAGDESLDGWHMFGGNARHDGVVGST